MTLTLDGASLTVNGSTYTTSQTIYLGPGTYPYTWTALDGFKGSGSGSITIGNCTPPDATASVTLGACLLSAGLGSITPVTITLNGASLTINGVTYTSTTTINLPPGTYPYTWTALDGFKGSGSGTIVISACSTPLSGTATVSTGACSWTQAGGSLTPVTITLDHATLTINGVTYTSTTTINLPPGTYPFTWAAVPGYTGGGSGTIVIGTCAPNPADASVSIGTCSWTEATGSLTPVTITIVGTSLTINGGTYTSSTIIYLPPGTYPYTWTALPGYTGSGSGEIVVGDCTPPDAAAVADPPGTCAWTEANGSLTPVPLTLDHASLTINGITYTSSQTIYLPPGSYYYTWTALPGYKGSGSGTVVIGDCPPPQLPNTPTNVESPLPNLGPVGGPAILIPVTGVDDGLLGRVLPGALFGLSFSFAGLGLVLCGLARRRDEDIKD